MKHYRIHVDVLKFEQILLHKHRFCLSKFQYCLN